jgi:S-formylglutathione hydrolase FrmB
MNKASIAVALALGSCAVAAQTHTHGLVKKTGTFPTEGALGADQPYWVWVPPDYDSTTRRYPVILFLHGKDAAIDEPKNEFLLDAYVRAADDGVVARSLIVFVDAQSGNETVSDGAVNFVYSFWADSQSAFRRVETDLVTLMDRVDADFRTLAVPGSNAFRVVTGFSMGGYGAARMATAYPQAFSAGIVIDGAVQNWEEMTRLATDNGNPTTSTYMYENKGYFDQKSPWASLEANGSTAVGATGAINANRVRFYSLGGLFGNADISGLPPATNNYVWDWDQALGAAGVPVDRHGFADTCEGHDLEDLMSPFDTREQCATDPAESLQIWHTVQAAYEETMTTSTARYDGTVSLSGAPAANSPTLTVGETGSNKHAAILSFNTGAVPDGKLIASAKLVVKRSSGGANVGGLGTLQVRMRAGAFGGSTNLVAGDYSAAYDLAGLPPVASFSTTVPDLEQPYEAVLSQQAVDLLNSTRGVVQFRLAYSGSTSATVQETILLASGDHSTFDLRPRLVLTYAP